jgi:hypothetical protein
MGMAKETRQSIAGRLFTRLIIHTYTFHRVPISTPSIGIWSAPDSDINAGSGIHLWHCLTWLGHRSPS